MDGDKVGLEEFDLVFFYEVCRIWDGYVCEIVNFYFRK